MGLGSALDGPSALGAPALPPEGIGHDRRSRPRLAALALAAARRAVVALVEAWGDTAGCCQSAEPHRGAVALFLLAGFLHNHLQPTPRGYLINVSDALSFCSNSLLHKSGPSAAVGSDG